MTFSHISDTHLGQTQYNTKEREEDMYNALKQAIDISIKNRVEFVIFAGDLFDKPKPDGRAIVTLGDELLKLRDAGIPAYFILGEHDISRMSGTPVSFIYNNFEVAKYIGDGEPVKVGNTLIVGFDKMRRDEIEEHREEFDRAQRQAEEHTGPSILVMHQGIIEANKFAGEMAVNQLPKSFSYYAMGHLHTKFEKKFESIGGGMIAYPGSTELASSEGIQESQKGFYQVDLSGSEPVMSWTRLDTRPHMVFSLAREELEGKISEMVSAITSHSKKPIVKVRVSGKHLDMNEINAIAKPLHEKALYCSIIPEQSVERTEIMTSEPSNTNKELLRHTKNSVNDDKLAEFAINDLLPLLSSNKTDEALSLVKMDYEEFRSKELK